MAKKRTARNTKTLPAAVADLKGDPANPRTIEEAAARGLQKSLTEFGDLAGITFNTRTGELVTGHQRVKQITERWGSLPIELDGDHGIIRSPEGHVFRVRFVDWTKARQRAANVAANSHKIAGDFNEDLDAFLEEIQADLASESPGLYDDLLFSELEAITVAQQTTATVESNSVESMELGEHEEKGGDIITLKFAFADEEQHAYVTHAVELVKSMESFSGVAIDGQAIAAICKRFILEHSK